MNERWFLLAASCLVCVGVRTTYEQLKKNGTIGGRNKVVFLLVFVAMVGMLASWPFMGSFDPSRVELPGIVRWFGGGTATVGILVAVGGLVQLRGVENIDHLVTSGLYAVIRHPMYLGFTLWIIGWNLVWGAPAALAVGLVCIGNIVYWRHLEECAMESRYGDEYRAYRRRSALARMPRFHVEAAAARSRR